MFICKERVVRDGHLVAFEGEEMTDEEAMARGLDVDPDEPQLEDLTVPQLRELAEQEGVDIPAKAKKAEIIDAINGEPDEDLYDDDEDVKEEACE